MLKVIMKRVLGKESDGLIRSGGAFLRELTAFVRNAKIRSESRKHHSDTADVIRNNGVFYARRVPTLDRVIYDENYLWLAKVVASCNIDWWWVDSVSHRARRAIGVYAQDREQINSAIWKYIEDHDMSDCFYLTSALRRVPVGQAIVSRQKDIWDSPVIRFSFNQYFHDSDRKFDIYFGCDLEFWEKDVDGSIIAPRENRAARKMDAENFSLIKGMRQGHSVRVPRIMQSTMIDDVPFPIDVVYTWVDGEDPAWQKRKNMILGADSNEYHSESTHGARFKSREELRFSLRSLDDFAPWINHIYIVTDSQIPEWLNLQNPKISIIDHQDIFQHKEMLPTFNSNAIISQIHRIPGLKEHFIYFNDDVMLGRPTRPEEFFLPSGLPLVSPSNNRRAFGRPSIISEPHFNLTINIRNLLLTNSGINVSRAIKHTPHPMVRSVLYKLEEQFSLEYVKTLHSKFRSHTDIVADQLFHYYSLINGRAALSNLRYDYINIRDDSNSIRLESLKRSRNKDCFCLNDAPVGDAQAIPEENIEDFLRVYFPAKSQYEN